jgi:4-phospho-D-threonate 3-dehydrogenase / 4-phospho-D-erythronate 3-dehydrogenase
MDIGPEISGQSFSKEKLIRKCNPLLIGDTSLVMSYLEKFTEVNIVIKIER